MSSLLIIGHDTPDTKIKQILRTFPSVEIYNIFGSTEVGPISYKISNTSTELCEYTTSKLVPGIQIYVQDSDTYEHLEAGVTGELMAGGPQLMTGYLENLYTDIN